MILPADTVHCLHAIPETSKEDMLAQGQASDIDIHAKEILYLREKLYALYHKHTLRPMDEIGEFCTGCASGSSGMAERPRLQTQICTPHVWHGVEVRAALVILRLLALQPGAWSATAIALLRRRRHLDWWMK